MTSRERAQNVWDKLINGEYSADSLMFRDSFAAEIDAAVQEERKKWDAYVVSLNDQHEQKIREATHRNTEEYNEGFNTGRIVGRDNERKAIIEFLHRQTLTMHIRDVETLIGAGKHLTPPSLRYEVRVFKDPINDDREELFFISDSVANRFVPGWHGTFADANAECDRLNKETT